MNMVSRSLLLCALLSATAHGLTAAQITYTLQGTASGCVWPSGFTCAPKGVTITNAALLMQEGKLGTIVAGAYADLLIVDGDPLTDVRVMLDPKKKLRFIMKDGIIYKNEL